MLCFYYEDKRPKKGSDSMNVVDMQGHQHQGHMWMSVSVWYGERKIVKLSEWPGGNFLKQFDPVVDHWFVELVGRIIKPTKNYLLFNVY